MMEIGTVTACMIGLNRDGTTPVRLAMCMVSGPTDIRTVQLIGAIDHWPVVGAKIAILEIEGAWEVGIVLEDIVAAVTTAIGDKTIGASVAGGVIDPTAKLQFKAATHESVFGDGVNYAVKYNELKTAFNTLRDDFNAFVTKYNGTVPAIGHVHTCPAGGGPTTAMPEGLAVMTTAVIEPSQCMFVRLP